ncbi:diguanylate cyclase domain-containing protein [uncultured Desulfobacter sp.]|uniref:sensor domain-containing diguanylate cyclase n=1 Tax=uncultured Desulfobacter sp. TaxID=240139 RepID=UPI002AABFEED|nr:diguanylate cyclase [uncultured Desulfobacter sp.]
MKCMNLIYKDPDDLMKIRDDLSRYLPENILIQVFCGISDIDAVNSLRSLLCALFPGSAVIGTSSAGEILNANIVQESIVISFTAFENIRARSALVDQNDDLTAGGKDMADALDDNKVKCIIVLGCGLKEGNYVNAFPFLKALNGRLSNAVIAGGLAAGYDEQQSRVFVFTEHGFTEHGFAAAALSGANLCVTTAHNLSWTPIGKKMTITHAKDGRLYSIDDKSVKDIYRQYLGIESGPSSLTLMNHFPLMIERRGMQVTNPVLSVNRDGSFNVLEKFEIGEQVRFSYCDAGLQEKGARQMGKQLAGCQPEAFFIYSCEFRRNIFEDDIVADMTVVQNGPASAGFFTFGECYTDKTKTPRFLQQTMTVLALSESDTCKISDEEEEFTEKIELPKAALKRFKLLKAMSHLVSSTTRELEMKNRQLEQLANKDGLTGLFNRRFFDDTLDRQLKEHGRSGAPLSLILMDVDFFKQFNDHYGHVAGDDCLRGISHLLQSLMRRVSDMAFRYGGEEFICILPATAHPGALQKAEILRSGVQDLEIPHELSQVAECVTVSLGVITLTDNREISPQALTKACDEQLYEAKHAGRNCLQGKNMSGNTDV